MRVLITGAGGFLGCHVVSAAIARGHKVRAMIRPAARTIPKSWQNQPKIEIVRCDLRAPSNLEEILKDIDTVIHLAASKAGDLYTQIGGTVLATEKLLNGMKNVGISKIILISTFSVYEYLHRRAWSKLDEESPLADCPLNRDEYCQTKLIQEQLVLDFANKNNWRCIVLRPGVLYGQDNLWTARLGMQLNKHWWIRIGSLSPLPLSYVENCAESIIIAAEYDGPEKQLILNAIDGDTPSQRTYLKELQKHLSPRPHIIPIPWIIMRSLSRLAWLVDHFCFKGTAKIPGLFIPSRLHARGKPLRYTNKKITTLNWQPKYSWKEGIQRSLEQTEEGK